MDFWLMENSLKHPFITEFRHFIAQRAQREFMMNVTETLGELFISIARRMCCFVSTHFVREMDGTSRDSPEL